MGEKLLWGIKYLVSLESGQLEAALGYKTTATTIKGSQKITQAVGFGW